MLYIGSGETSLLHPPTTVGSGVVEAAGRLNVVARVPSAGSPAHGAAVARVTEVPLARSFGLKAKICVKRKLTSRAGYRKLRLPPWGVEMLRRQAEVIPNEQHPSRLVRRIRSPGLCATLLGRSRGERPEDRRSAGAFSSVAH